MEKGNRYSYSRRSRYSIPPQVAYAATSVTFDISKGSVSINDDTYSGYSSTGVELSGTSSGKAFIITGTTTTNTVTVAGTQEIILSDCNIDVSATAKTCAFKIVDDNDGTITVNLDDNTENVLKSGKYCAALQKNGTAGKLIINGPGSLSATSGSNSSAIGSSNGFDAYNITINSGTIEALAITINTSSGGAGIGSGSYGNCDNIVINGGIITAQSEDGAGIGAGVRGNSFGIVINGGNIQAIGGAGGAGIGASNYCNGSYGIYIRGGTIISKGGANGAGIGAGGGGNGGADTHGDGSYRDIVISGGIITAIGGGYRNVGAAGIGGSWEGVSVSGITISGGTVTAIGAQGSAGVGGGFAGSCTDICISNCSAKISGTASTINSETYYPSDLGNGVQYADAGFSNGTKVTPTNGSDSVYCCVISNSDNTEVLIDGVSYTPVNHTALDSSDTNLYAYLTVGPHTITASSLTDVYTYSTDIPAWYTAPLSTSINYGQSLSTSTISSDVIDEQGYVLSGSWQWASPTEIPNGAGKHTYSATFKKGA